MSRIGNRILEIPAGVEIKQIENSLTIKGPKGELTKTFDPAIKIEIKDNQITTTRKNDLKRNKQLHGTTNSLIKGMLDGVVNGYEKVLEVNGVGYRAFLEGTKLKLQVGFSHPVYFDIPKGIKIEVPSQTEIKVSGIDKQWTNEIAARIFSIKKPEPYGGKGINYKGAYIRRKAGKSAKK